MHDAVLFTILEVCTIFYFVLLVVSIFYIHRDPKMDLLKRLHGFGLNLSRRVKSLWHRLK